MNEGLKINISNKKNHLKVDVQIFFFFKFKFYFFMWCFLLYIEAHRPNGRMPNFE